MHLAWKVHRCTEPRQLDGSEIRRIRITLLHPVSCLRADASYEIIVMGRQIRPGAICQPTRLIVRLYLLDHIIHKLNVYIRSGLYGEFQQFRVLTQLASAGRVAVVIGAIGG